MPIITYECAHATKEQKDAIIEKLTKTASAITSIPEASFTVLIKEFPTDNWGIGGTSLEQILKNR